MRRTITVLIPILMIISGCGGARKVLIEVNVLPKLDMTRYRNVAVLPMIPINKDDDGDSGESIAYFFRRELSKIGEIDVVDYQKSREVAKIEELDKDDLSNQSLMMDIAGELSADLIVTGTYELSSSSEPRIYYVDQYSQALRQYVSKPVTYYERVYHLRLHVIIIDGKTGAQILEQEYSPSYSEAHNIGTLLISEVTQTEPDLQRLVAPSARNLGELLSPHKKKEERYLVK